jgi:hypothetical protein
MQTQKSAKVRTILDAENGKQTAKEVFRAVSFWLVKSPPIGF